MLLGPRAPPRDGAGGRPPAGCSGREGTGTRSRHPQGKTRPRDHPDQRLSVPRRQQHGPRALPRKRCRWARGLAAGGGPARGGACFRRAAPRGADAGSGRRAEPSERSGGGGGPARPAVHHGGQAAHPHGQREAQQEHHAARERRQDLEDGPGGEGVGRALAAGAVHLRGLRISYLPDHPEHPDGHVRGPSPGEARPHPQRCHELSPPAGAPSAPVHRSSCRGAVLGIGRVTFQVPSRVIPSFLAHATVP